tara:strand:+ start:872 stop:1081 length:210 start_codon:yes stop_codon:yes gene_type:complete
MNLGIFIIGALTFLVSFVLFKINAFRKTKNDENSWSKLLLVFLVDYLILMAGVLATGIIFVSLFNVFHG